MDHCSGFLNYFKLILNLPRTAAAQQCVAPIEIVIKIMAIRIDDIDDDDLLILE